MIPNGAYSAVVDRIEDGLAALEVETEAGLAELLVDPVELPEPAKTADAVLRIQIIDGSLAEANYLPEETESRKKDAQSRFDRLSQRPPEQDGDGDDAQRS